MGKMAVGGDGDRFYPTNGRFFFWVQHGSEVFSLLVVGLGGGFRAFERRWGGEPGDYTSTFKVDSLAVLGQAIAIEPRGALPGPEGDELRMLQDIRSGNLKSGRRRT